MTVLLESLWTFQTSKPNIQITLLHPRPDPICKSHLLNNVGIWKCGGKKKDPFAATTCLLWASTVSPAFTHASLSQWTESAGTCGMHLLLQVSPHRYNWVKGRTLTGPIQRKHCLSLPLEFWWNALGHFLTCPIINFGPSMRFWSRICWYYSKFTVPGINMETSRFRGVKAASDLHISTFGLIIVRQLIRCFCPDSATVFQISNQQPINPP